MCTMLLCQQVETGGGEEVAEILDAREGGGESSGSEAELLLVVGIDQPQLPVDDAEMAGAECFLKPFDGCPAAFDVEQFGDGTLVLFGQVAQDGCIKPVGQQMNERQLGAPPALAYLLVSAKRHLPSRKGSKENSLLFQKVADVGEEGLFRSNVLYHIVQDDDVVFFLFVFGNRGFEKVGADESALLLVPGKEVMGLVNAALCEGNSGNCAAEPGKGK